MIASFFRNKTLTDVEGNHVDARDLSPELQKKLPLQTFIANVLGWELIVWLPDENYPGQKVDVFLVPKNKHPQLSN